MVEEITLGNSRQDMKILETKNKRVIFKLHVIGWLSVLSLSGIRSNSGVAALFG